MSAPVEQFVPREKTIDLSTGETIRHEFRFTMQREEGNARIFKCKVLSSVDLYPNELLTAVKFPSLVEAKGYALRASSRPFDFKGFMIFKINEEDKEEVYLLGEYIGSNIDEWASGNRVFLWETRPNGVLRANHVSLVGKIIVTILTDRHQDNKYVGDLRKALHINDSHNSLEVVLVNLEQNHPTNAAGIVEDLKQLREILEQCEVEAHFQGTKPADLELFYELFPPMYPIFLQDVKQLSYKICHAPIFWGFKERYIFAMFFWEIRKEDRDFKRLVTLNKGKTNVGNWRSKIPKDKCHILYKVFKGGYGYDEVPASIMEFHRNVMSHCSKDFPVGMAEADEKLRDIFPDAYHKAYLELFEKFQDFQSVQSKEVLNRLQRGRHHRLFYGK